MPEISSDNILSHKQLNQYHLDGFLAVRGLFTSDEVNGWQSECERLLGLSDVIHEDNWRTNFIKTNKGVWYLEKIDPIVDISETFRNLSEDVRIINLVRQLLQNDKVHLFRDKLIIKTPGHMGYGLHQDYSWWHKYPPDEICTLAIAIDEANEQNGPLCHNG